jgi:TolB protein
MAGGASESSERPAGPPACGRIAFAREVEHERHRMYVMPAGGGPSTPLSIGSEDPQRSDYAAAITPDASAILVLSSLPGEEGRTRDSFALLELARPDAPARPIGPHAQLRNPSFAPDGRWLVFESDAASFRDLYRLELEGGSLLRLTDDAHGNFEPDVSPDGSAIAFVSSRDGDAEIYVMSSDGGEPRRLTSSRGDDSAPRWSPAGGTIAFTSNRERARGIDLYLMDAQGEGQRPLVTDPERSAAVLVRDVAWSPDASKIAFTQVVPQGKGGGVLIVASESGEILARTQPAGGVDEQPAWSPDGESLVFARSEGEGSVLVRMRADGSDLQRLSEGQGVDWLPRWIADPTCTRARPTTSAQPGGRGQG